MASDDLYPFAADAREFPLGTDIAGVYNLDYALGTVSGPRALAEAILRRLTTPRGGLFYDPSYGYDLGSIIGSTVPASVVEQRVLEQVLAEEEVEDATCTAAFAHGVQRVAISVVAADESFELTLLLDSLRLEVTALLGDIELFKEAA